MLLILQQRKKYLRKTLLFIAFEMAHYGKSSVSIFKESFACIEKIFFLVGRLGTSL